MSRLVGLQAPDFTATAVVDQEFKEVTLSSYRGKYVVLFFYPLDFTFVCPTEITAFSDRYSDFSSRNCEVLGVSVDSQFSHLAWVQTDRKNGGLGDIELCGGQVERAADAVQHVDDRLRAVAPADAQPAQTVDLGEGAGHHDVVARLDQGLAADSDKGLGPIIGEGPHA